ncbi:MerR family transcriptional regulator [Kineococcus aurantiacus]|uniref:DNA-binding transcriptional MerR regulator n=1 Tax=Kineococcus aurantiacus TaxID=37633 RepID=A0A7Y9DMT8_9ACTN|nr:DNA-binding transcriptional MerR regulator [Kineococcus aurantiacus]
MRIGELSERSGVSAASIEYYAREGLLPPGERTGCNQTESAQAHLERLRLIRSLIDVGGLSVAATHGWHVHGEQNPGVRIVAAVLDAWAAAGREDLAAALPACARAAEVVAQADLDTVADAVDAARAGGDRAAAAQTVVVGTVLGDRRGARDRRRGRARRPGGRCAAPSPPRPAPPARSA